MKTPDHNNQFWDENFTCSNVTSQKIIYGYHVSIYKISNAQRLFGEGKMLLFNIRQ